MKIYHFFLTLIVLSIVWTIFLKPYKIEEKNVKDLAEVVFDDFILYEFDQNGLKNRLIGKEGIKYQDRLVVIEPNYLRFENSEEKLKANKGVYEKDIIHLFGDIEYTTKDFTFFTQEAIYDMKNDIVKSKARFKLLTKTSEVIGDNLIYYRNVGKILAKNIYTKINTKK